MSLLQESVNALTAAAGWKKASPGADGVFRFRLEGDLDMEFFSPDGRTGHPGGPILARFPTRNRMRTSSCGSAPPVWRRPHVPGGRSFRWMKAGFHCTLLCLWRRALPRCRDMPRTF